MQMEYRKADSEILERLWEKNIQNNAGDNRWIYWKREFIANNQTGRACTFVILCDGEPVGECTLLFSPACNAIAGRDQLADFQTVANVHALRIDKAYEGKGYVSELMHFVEKSAAEMGYTSLTIGVYAKETRNLSVYLHWGYTDFVLSEVEDGELTLYYRKELR